MCTDIYPHRNFCIDLKSYTFLIENNLYVIVRHHSLENSSDSGLIQVAPG